MSYSHARWALDSSTGQSPPRDEVGRVTTTPKGDQAHDTQALSAWEDDGGHIAVPSRTNSC